MSADPKKTEREIWDRAVAEGKKEPRFELTVDKAAIRKVLKESRWQHTVRVKSHLP